MAKQVEWFLCTACDTESTDPEKCGKCGRRRKEAPPPDWLLEQERQEALAGEGSQKAVADALYWLKVGSLAQVVACLMVFAGAFAAGSGSGAGPVGGSIMVGLAALLSAVGVAGILGTFIRAVLVCLGEIAKNAANRK